MSGVSRNARIGIAIGDDIVVGTVRVGGRPESVTIGFAWPSASDQVGTALATAFEALRARLAIAVGHELEGGRVDIALLPPLSDARLVPLPPLRQREAESVIRRDAARHFVGGAIPRAVAVMQRSSIGGAAASIQPVLAAAAPVPVLEAVRSAAHHVGWTVDAIVPAHGAWMAGPDGKSGRSRASLAVFAAHGEAVHVIRIEGGTVTSVRRVPEALTAEVIAAAGAAPGNAIVCGEAGQRETLSRAVAAAGWVLVDDAARSRTAAEVAALRAARSPIELVPPSVTVERWRRTRGLGRQMAVAAVFLLAVAAALELWGTGRELAAVRARRAEIRSQVVPLIDTRDSINRMNERTEAIRSLEQESPRWTRALFDLSLLLPSDSYITSLITRGDTLVIEASGARAGEAMQALRRSGSLKDIRLEGLVERELEDGSTTVERFRLSARLTDPLEIARPSVLSPAGTTAGSAALRVDPGGRE